MTLLIVLVAANAKAGLVLNPEAVFRQSAIHVEIDGIRYSRGYSLVGAIESSGELHMRDSGIELTDVYAVFGENTQTYAYDIQTGAFTTRRVYVDYTAGAAVFSQNGPSTAGWQSYSPLRSEGISSNAFDAVASQSAITFRVGDESSTNTFTAAKYDTNNPIEFDKFGEGYTAQFGVNMWDGTDIQANVDGINFRVRGTSHTGRFSFSNAVPEPGSASLLGMCIAGLVMRRGKR